MALISIALLVCNDQRIVFNGNPDLVADLKTGLFQPLAAYI
jgi:hypothetical protein